MAGKRRKTSWEPMVTYPSSRSGNYVLLRDGKEVTRGSEQDVRSYIHRHHSYSIDHALKHEGYKIVPAEHVTGANMAGGSSPVQKMKFKLKWDIPKGAATPRGQLRAEVKKPAPGSVEMSELWAAGFRDSYDGRTTRMYKTLGHYLCYDDRGARPVQAVSVVTGQTTQDFATVAQARKWLTSEAKRVAKKEQISLNFVLSSGARSGSRVGAHRATRTRRHLGASVNRAGKVVSTKPVNFGEYQVVYLGDPSHSEASPFKATWGVMQDGKIIRGPAMRHDAVFVVEMATGKHEEDMNRTGSSHRENENGLTFSRWLDAAGGTAHVERVAPGAAFKAWRSGEDPSDYRAARRSA